MHKVYPPIHVLSLAQNHCALSTLVFLIVVQWTWQVNTFNACFYKHSMCFISIYLIWWYIKYPLTSEPSCLSWGEGVATTWQHTAGWISGSVALCVRRPRGGMVKRTWRRITCVCLFWTLRQECRLLGRRSMLDGCWLVPVTILQETTSLNRFGVVVNDDQSTCHKLCRVTNTVLQTNR